MCIGSLDAFRTILFPQFKLGDERPVTVDVDPLEVVQQPFALPNQTEKTLLCREVFLLRFQVLSELIDAKREQGNL